MMWDSAIHLGITCAVLAFAAEYIDSSLGMGYGTTLTPILLLLGVEPLQVVPAILLSQLIAGLAASVIHHAVGNVNLRPKTLHPRKIYHGL